MDHLDVRHAADHLALLGEACNLLLRKVAHGSRERQVALDAVVFDLASSFLDAVQLFGVAGFVVVAERFCDAFFGQHRTGVARVGAVYLVVVDIDCDGRGPADVAGGKLSAFLHLLELTHFLQEQRFVGAFLLEFLDFLLEFFNFGHHFLLLGRLFFLFENLFYGVDSFLCLAHVNVGDVEGVMVGIHASFEEMEGAIGPFIGKHALVHVLEVGYEVLAEVPRGVPD
mmetsp:Transcript_76764/g.166132  ORF Transcript_76764/g.166132 Transcript_76764/m.166132 type:complete len:227 (+) Transcript_76764:867-1547(+)